MPSEPFVSDCNLHLSAPSTQDLLDPLTLLHFFSHSCYHLLTHLCRYLLSSYSIAWLPLLEQELCEVEIFVLFMDVC